MRGLLALADDLTGALEVGAKFAGRGIPSLVTASSTSRSTHCVEVIDLESRHLTPEAASAAVIAFGGTRARIVYLKTDSTLRGNIAAELGALARAFPDSPIHYMPAYPALGRTVKDGVLYVRGVPVHRTAFASDPLEPVTDSFIPHLVQGIANCTVHDGETDADISRATAAAMAISGRIILAGPASVAAEIAAQLAPVPTPLPPWPRMRTCLIVNGSRHEISARQIAAAQARGCASESSSADWRVLNVAGPAALPPLEFAAGTGSTVRRYVEETNPDAVMVFGGDTAFGILKAFRCPGLEPIGEVFPGMPVSRVENRGFYLITKAGGFGDESLICDAKRLLHGND